MTTQRAFGFLLIISALTFGVGRAAEVPKVPNSYLDVVDHASFSQN